MSISTTPDVNAVNDSQEKVNTLQSDQVSIVDIMVKPTPVTGYGIIKSCIIGIERDDIREVNNHWVMKITLVNKVDLKSLDFVLPEKLFYSKTTHSAIVDLDIVSFEKYLVDRKKIFLLIECFSELVCKLSGKIANTLNFDDHQSRKNDLENLESYSNALKICTEYLSLSEKHTLYFKYTYQ